MRLMVFLVVAVVFGLWIWGCLSSGRYIPLGYSEAGIISSALFGKAVQSRFEYGGSLPGMTAYRPTGAGAGDITPSLRNLEEGRD